MGRGRCSRPLVRVSSPSGVAARDRASVPTPQQESRFIMAPRHRSQPPALLLALVCPLASAPAAEEAKKPTHPFPGPEKADIWVLAGQSNMGGWGLLKAPIETDPRVMEFKNPKWVPAENPMHRNFVSPG